MPEGPEVKAYAMFLRDNNIMTIVDIVSSDNFKISFPLTVISINTKGKLLWIDCIDNVTESVQIQITFGLNGSFQTKCDKWKVKFVCDSDFEFFYCGGLFGDVKIGPVAAKITKLGVDILDPLLDETEIELLVKNIKSHGNAGICSILLRQDIICGIGNYIKSEVLFACGISPHAKIRDIPHDMIRDLYKKAHEIGEIFFECLISRSSSTSGLYKVYNKKKTGEHTVLVETIGGRKTFWVPELQTCC